MPTILEALKERVEIARARVTTAQQAFQLAHVELQAANSDLAVWNNAVMLEQREEEKRISAVREVQERQYTLPDIPSPSAERYVVEAVVSHPDSDHLQSFGAAINKTERVRETLRSHVGGITPAGLWIELKDHLSSRAYLYSILKRLRDNEEVTQRRGKYILKPKPVEVKTDEVEGMTVQ